MKTKPLLMAFLGLLAFAGATMAQVWVLSTSSATTSWTSIAASADGTKLVAAANSGDRTQSWICTSTNSGASWTATNLYEYEYTISNSVALGWLDENPLPDYAYYYGPYNALLSQVASSAQGDKFIALGAGNEVPPGGSGGVYEGIPLTFLAATSIYNSTNFGTSWQPNFVSGNNGDWTCLAASMDGTKLVAAGDFWPSPGQNPVNWLYNSTNSGMTWVPIASPATAWGSIAMSADGTKLVAAASYGNISGLVYTSTNFGTNWTATTLPVAFWGGVASSSDGNKLVAVGVRYGYARGLIYTSTNSGATWMTNSAPSEYWGSVASSADGNTLVAAVFDSQLGGPIYTSTDSGLTWTQNGEPDLTWTSVASSADGSKLFAVAGLPVSYVNDYPNGAIYTLQSIPALNIHASGANLVISWPNLSSSLGYVLQENSDLTTSNWTDTAELPVIDGNQNETILPTPSQSMFYRLKHPDLAA